MVSAASKQRLSHTGPPFYCTANKLHNQPLNKQTNKQTKRAHCQAIINFSPKALVTMQFINGRLWKTTKKVQQCACAIKHDMLRFEKVSGSILPTSLYPKLAPLLRPISFPNVPCVSLSNCGPWYVWVWCVVCVFSINSPSFLPRIIISSDISISGGAGIIRQQCQLLSVSWLRVEGLPLLIRNLGVPCLVSLLLCEAQVHVLLAM
jgi:hypothetical protein